MGNCARDLPARGLVTFPGCAQKLESTEQLGDDGGEHEIKIKIEAEKKILSRSDKSGKISL